MNRRIRSTYRVSPTRAEPYLRYLKPGALAQLRDSRVNARSNRINLFPQIYCSRLSPPSSPVSNDGQLQVNSIDRFPCISVRNYGPRCILRKKLMAAKAVLLSNSLFSGPVSESPDPIIDVISTDNIVSAH